MFFNSQAPFYALISSVEQFLNWTMSSIVRNEVVSVNTTLATISFSTSVGEGTTNFCGSHGIRYRCRKHFIHLYFAAVTTGHSTVLMVLERSGGRSLRAGLARTREIAMNY